MVQYNSNSAQETQEIAASLAVDFVKKRAVVLALIGDLGSGKTTFTQGFAKALGISDKVISPTFVLMRQHILPEQERMLYHIDLYRLEGKINSKELGLDELFSDPENIVLIEWAEKLEDALPDSSVKIKFEKVNNDSRKITVEKPN
jgi:tRNA threonylcarbamoyladenosine biosynthesis protein TsaE